MTTLRDRLEPGGATRAIHGPGQEKEAERCRIERQRRIWKSDLFHNSIAIASAVGRRSVD